MCRAAQRAMGRIAAACGVFLAGCQPEFYRAETTLHSDGSVERAIYQPSLPEEASEPGAWEAVKAVPKIEPRAWDGRIQDVATSDTGRAPAAQGTDQKKEYTAAWGRFASVDLVPDHYVKESIEPLKQSRLQRSYSSDDYGLVAEHRWEETLTEIVTLHDMRTARQEWAALHLAVMEDVLAEGLEAGHDVSEVLRWLHSEGLAWFDELCDAYVESRVRRRGFVNADFEARVFEVCARHGLQLTDEQGRKLEDPAIQERVQQFAEQKLRKLVRAPGGGPPDGKTIDSILVWAGLKKNTDAAGNEIPSPLTGVQQTVIDRKHRGSEAFKADTDILVNRFFGLYGFPLKRPQHFHYTLRVPGQIIATNGTLHSENEVRWTFETAEAYPFGYSMTCRSLEPNLARQQKLLGEGRVTSRADMQTYVDLVTSDAELLAAMRQCATDESLEPLRQLHSKSRKRLELLLR